MLKNAVEIPGERDSRVEEVPFRVPKAPFFKLTKAVDRIEVPLVRREIYQERGNGSKKEGHKDEQDPDNGAPTLSGCRACHCSSLCSDFLDAAAERAALTERAC